MKKTFSNFILHLGIPPSLLWGFVGILFFIIGATIEQSWFPKCSSIWVIMLPLSVIYL